MNTDKVLTQNEKLASVFPIRVYLCPSVVENLK